MKKIYILFMLALIGFNANAQDGKITGIFIGGVNMVSPENNYSFGQIAPGFTPTQAPTEAIGMEIGLVIHNFIADFSFHQGDAYRFNAKETLPSDIMYSGTQNLITWHLGYSVNVFNKNNFGIYFTPKLGMMQVSHNIRNQGSSILGSEGMSNGYFDYGADVIIDLKGLLMKAGWTKYNTFSAGVGININQLK